MITIDIDTGGTMTDALVSDGVSRHAFKVDTTPHDYTVSFLACLQEAARHFEHANVEAFLATVGLIRWSSTITTNVLGERRGSRIGLLVSSGHEQDLYGRGRSPVLGELVSESNVIGLPPQPTPVDILSGVRRLLEGGVRRICVCLADAFPDNSAEAAIKAVIEGQYPDHIIGSVPVLLGSEMAPLRHDQTRVHYSLINAYTHSQLATSLYRAEDLLRDEHRWDGPLLVGHTSGGVARIGKTKAADTIESGPVFGTYGGAHMAQLYGLDSALCFDVGGTTTKASIVREGAPVLQRGGELMAVPVKSSFALLRSAVIGGGSVARVKGGALTLGPDSMGAAPGPACYCLGGTRATLTDALLVLGYLDPANFMGGRRELKAEPARRAIAEHVAEPLGVSVEVAALSIRDEAVAMMSELLGNILKEGGLKAADSTLFAFGGNGPMFAAFVADKLGLPRAYIFDLGPVFSAFGSAISDVVHRYERGLGGTWDDAAHTRLKPLCDAMSQQAVRDLNGEGFDPSSASFEWELDLGTGEDEVSTLRASGAAADAPAAIARAVADAKATGRALLALRLTTRYVVGAHGVTKRTARAAERSPANREARFHGGTAEPAKVRRWESLNPGDRIAGPALVNGSTLTCPVPPGWQLQVDDYGNAVLSRRG